jgi:predicted RNA-binding Zn ribbon-like protein
MDARTWMELANSDRHDYLGLGIRRDDLDDPQWPARFLRRWGMEVPPGPREHLVRALKRLRRVLQREAGEIVSGRTVRPENLKEVNVFLNGSPLIRRVDFSRGRARVMLEPVQRTVSSVLGEIAFSFADTIVNLDVSRIKTCGNRDCGWVFYDGSRNKTRRWCEPTCSNLMKVRRFRQKRRR